MSTPNQPFEPVSDYEARDYSRLQRDLDRVKSSVFRRPDAAFFGPLMCSLDFVWSDQIDTAGCDGERFWWNPDFFDQAPATYSEPRFNEFVLMHELWHAAKLHVPRLGSRCPDYWNYACDIRINNDLVNGGYSFGTFPAWHRPDMDTRPDPSDPTGKKTVIMAEEDIYDEIFRNPPSGGTLSNSPWGNGDMVVGPDDASGGTTQGAVNNVVKAIQSAKVAGQPGSIPGNIEQIVDSFLSPIIPWEQHLSQWMSDLAEEDFTWARPDRRFSASGMYLPSRFEDEGRLEHLVYFQDVSGSVTDRDIMRFNSELKHVWDVFRPQRMTIAQFDTRITKVDEFEEGDPYEKIVIVGRGGTSLVPVREMIEKLEPTAAIVFSDMQCAPMDRLTKPIPVLWVAVDGGWGVGHEPTFGKTIRIKS